MASRIYSFNKCIRRTIIQFLALFNDIQIERYEQDGTIKGRHLVPLKFVPKSKAYMWVTERGRDEEMLPMMIVTMTGIDFDPNRLTNRHEDIRVSTDYSSLTSVYSSNAIPYNISFSLQIFALHNIDIDQIYEQILPYFTPQAYIIINIPEMDMSFEAKVVLNSCSPMMTDDTTEEEARVIKWETQFQVQMYLFKPTFTSDIIGPTIGTPPFDTSTSAAEFIDKGDWTIGVSYSAGDYVLDDGTYYVALVDNISSDATEPGLTSASVWTSGAEYYNDSVVLHDTTYYVSSASHIADETNEPPLPPWTELSGPPITTIWQELALPPAPSGWSSEDGWTDGWALTAGASTWVPVSASKGGAVFRFYVDRSKFLQRDTLLDDTNVWTDTTETLAIQPLALIPETVDTEAKILLDMELFEAD